MNVTNYPTYDEAKEAAIAASKKSPLGVYVKENPYQGGYVLTNFAEYIDEPCAMCGSWMHWQDDDFYSDF